MNLNPLATAALAQEVGISDKSSTKSYIECMSQHAQKVYL